VHGTIEDTNLILLVAEIFLLSAPMGRCLHKSISPCASRVTS